MRQQGAVQIKFEIAIEQRANGNVGEGEIGAQKKGPVFQQPVNQVQQPAAGFDALGLIAGQLRCGSGVR